MRTTTLLAVPLLALTLASCSNGDRAEPNTPDYTDETAMPEPTSADPIAIQDGTTLEWADDTGATGTVTFGTEPDPLISEAAEIAGAGPLTWATVETDNRQGTDTVSVQSLLLFTEDGQTIEMPTGCGQVTTWDEANDDPYTNRLNDIAWECESPDASVGEVASKPVVYEGELPAEVARVAVVLPGFVEADAYPAP